MDCTSGSRTGRGVWSVPEHERFIEAMSLYPRGPWKLITAYVGSRSIKQVQTHAQKYQQKLQRQQRGLRKRKINVKRPEHRVDPSTLDQFTHKCIVRYAQRLGKKNQGQRHPLQEQEADEDVTDSASSTPAQSPAPSYSYAQAATNLTTTTPVVPASSSTSLDASLVGATLSDWLAMTKDATADAKLLELLPEVYPSNEDVDGNGLLKLEYPSADWGMLQFDPLVRPTHPSNPVNSGFVFDGPDGPSRKCVV